MACRGLPGSSAWVLARRRHCLQHRPPVVGARPLPSELTAACCTPIDVQASPASRVRASRTQLGGSAGQRLGGRARLMYMCCRACGRPRSRRPLANGRHGAPAPLHATRRQYRMVLPLQRRRPQVPGALALPAAGGHADHLCHPLPRRHQGAWKRAGLWVGGWAGGCMAGAAGLAAAPCKAQGNAACAPCLHRAPPPRAGLALTRRAFPKPCDARLFAAPPMPPPPQFDISRSFRWYRGLSRSLTQASSLGQVGGRWGVAQPAGATAAIAQQPAPCAALRGSLFVASFCRARASPCSPGRHAAAGTRPGPPRPPPPRRSSAATASPTSSTATTCSSSLWTPATRRPRWGGDEGAHGCLAAGLQGWSGKGRVAATAAAQARAPPSWPRSTPEPRPRPSSTGHRLLPRRRVRARLPVLVRCLERWQGGARMGPALPRARPGRGGARPPACRQSAVPGSRTSHLLRPAPRRSLSYNIRATTLNCGGALCAMAEQVGRAGGRLWEAGRPGPQKAWRVAAWLPVLS